MKKPDQIRPEDLEHPKGLQKAWNGDMRKPRSDRWNGASDYEDRGFTERRKGLSVTEGTRAPSNVKPKKAPPLSRALTDKGPNLFPEPLKPHQEQMLSQRQRTQNRRKGGQK